MSESCGAIRILILNGDLPIFPGRAGHEYLHTTLLAQRAQRVGLVSMVHTPEQHEKKQELARAGIELYLWESPQLHQSSAGTPTPPTWPRRVGKTLYSTWRTRLQRPQDTALQDLQLANMAESVLQALQVGSWQALVVVQSNCAHWLDTLPRLPVRVLVMHDVRAMVYERWAHATPTLGPWLVRWLQAWLYRGFEKTYAQQYDLIVTVSLADEAWVRQHYRPTRLVTVPIPVDSAYFQPLPDVREETARVVFTGAMDHPPNTDAAEFFACYVLPVVQRTLPEAEFWIVGSNPPAHVQALERLHGVVVTGFVPDIRPYIAQATVVVVPLRFGSGMRNKILEAWAMQKCVVSTRIGAEGLDYKEDVNILIADDVQTMAEKVVQAMTDASVREQIRTQGRALVMTQHHPDVLARQYYQAIAAVVRDKQQQGSPMRIVIDLRWMTPGRAGGIENLSRSFVQQLLQLDACNRYTVLVPAEVKYDFDVRAHPNIVLTVVNSPGAILRRLFWRGTQALHSRLKIHYWRSSAVEALRRLRAWDAEIALSVPGYIHLDLYPLAHVLIVPDIQHEYHPEFFSPQVLHERRRIYTDSIRRAQHLCAISEFTRHTLIERLSVPPEQVTTTHLAADPIFQQPKACSEHQKQVLDKYGLCAGEYLFFPGHTWPHKNHRTAFQALRILQESYHLDPLLVCTGNPREAHPDLLRVLHEWHLERRVRFLGYCPTSDMPVLYAGAAALVFPSFFEGFGMPLLEAMWCGCPVVCSNTTSLPEIAGDAAVLIDPHDPEHLAEATHRVLTDEALRGALIERGQQQAQKFSWRRFTLDIVRILHHVRELRYG